ncbi:PaaI family thioesterase [Halomonas sp. WWR20]
MHSRLKAVLEHPLHRYLGIKTLESNQGQGRLVFDVNENAINPAGVLHGGVVYTLCDVCAYAGLLSELTSAQEAVTHDIHVSVMRAAKHGESVVVESRIVKQGRSLCFIDVTATSAGKLIATARVTKSIIEALG